MTIEAREAGIGRRSRRVARPGAGVQLALASLVALTAGLVAVAPAQAAVRTCQAVRSSGLVAAPTENEGKRRAITAWMEQVKPLGPRYMGWGSATRRLLKCARAKDGQFQCIAMAMPCMVQQNPGIPGPPGRRPSPRKRPGDPGRPIDI